MIPLKDYFKPILCPNCKSEVREMHFSTINEEGRREGKMGFRCSNCKRSYLSPDWKVKSGELVKT